MANLDLFFSLLLLVNVSGWHFRHRAACRSSTMIEKYVFRARRHGSLARPRMPDVLDHLNSDSVDTCVFSPPFRVGVCVSFSTFMWYLARLLLAVESRVCVSREQSVYVLNSN